MKKAKNIKINKMKLSKNIEENNPLGFFLLIG